MNRFGAITGGDDYSRHHIIDPRTQVSPVETASASVIAPTAMEADALSTALMVMGPREGLVLIERLPNFEAMLVGKDLTIERSKNFPAQV